MPRLLRSWGAVAPNKTPTRTHYLVVLIAIGLALLLLPTTLPVAHAQPVAPVTAPASPAAPVQTGSNSSTNTSSSWTNISSSVGTAPSGRSLAQFAYSPALNATILFGGYNGSGGNFPLGDTWEFAGNRWTELFPALSPSPRWGATMVYDPDVQALLLFGGRNATAFFNDTWEFTASGWHQILTTSAPSPRYDYGMAFDAALGQVVLYGGGIGNNPAGTFTNFVFYTDTWTFQGTAWTNVTSSVGPGPVGRLIRDQMAYDARDGYLLVTGGYSYVPYGTETPCGYITFNATWGQTWKLEGTGWSEVLGATYSPPDGQGVIWYDPQANETLYYEGTWLGPADQCDVGGNVVWSYAAGNWTLVTEGNVSAPAPRQQTVFVDDLGDNEQIVFGGEMASSGSESYGVYLADTWTYQPTWVTFDQHGLPSGAHWHVTLQKFGRRSSTGHPILFVEGPGRYSYVAEVVRSGTLLAETSGTFLLTHRPDVEAFSYSGLTERVFSVSFRESKLPAGTLWSVTVHDQATFSSSSRTITVGEPAGAYTYTVASGNSHFAALGGSFHVAGGPVSKAVRFVRLVYAMTVGETGLPAASHWCVVVIGGKSHCSTAGSIGFLEPNGSYSYRLTTTRAGYSAPEGSFDVAGSAVTFSVTFAKA